MLNINLLESLTLKCSCMKKPKTKGEDKEENDVDSKIYDVISKYNVSILQMPHNHEITNLYPNNGDVTLWNIFVIGSDKTYILADVRDPDSKIPNSNRLLNHQGINIIPDDLFKILDSIWDKTLLGKQLQFYMVWNDKLYFVNTYPFFNKRNYVIGAIMFMRKFESNQYKFTSIDNKRPSKDLISEKTNIPINTTTEIITDDFITCKIKEYMTQFTSQDSTSEQTFTSPFVFNSQLYNQMYTKSGKINFDQI